MFLLRKKPPLPWALASSKAQLDELLTFLGAGWNFQDESCSMGFLCFSMFFSMVLTCFNPLKNEKIPWNVPCWSCFFSPSFLPQPSNPALAVAKFGSHSATGVLHIWKPCRCAPPKDTFFPLENPGLHSWKVETRNSAPQLIPDIYSTRMYHGTTRSAQPAVSWHLLNVW